MSVDTHLKGKRMTGRYRSYDEAGARVLVAHSLMGWGYWHVPEAMNADSMARIKARVEHKHRPT